MRNRVHSPFTILSFLLCATILISIVNAQLQEAVPPPTPRFILTQPSMNQISYIINVNNQGGENAADVTLDFAIPKTSAPDSYVEIKNIEVTSEDTILQESYADRGNNRLRVIQGTLRPNEQLSVNVSFISLRYRVEYPRPMLSGAGYPAEYSNYTQPEMYIESNDPFLVSKAQALMGARVDTYRIAQRMYDFVISYLSYAKQSETRGALWA